MESQAALLRRHRPHQGDLLGLGMMAVLKDCVEMIPPLLWQAGRHRPDPT